MRESWLEFVKATIWMQLRRYNWAKYELTDIVNADVSIVIA